MTERAKVTKEVLCEEARFILANVMAEARYGRQNRYEDIRRVCEGAVSIPFGEYVGFLEKSGYLRHDRANEGLEVTPDGEMVVNGAQLGEFTERAVSHFKKLRQSRMHPPTGAPSMGSQSGVRPPPQAPAAIAAEVAAAVDALGPAETPFPQLATNPLQPLIQPTAPAPAPREPAPIVPVPTGTSAGVAPSRRDPRVQHSGGRATAVAGGEIGGDSDGRYEKISAIGSGGMGTVYRARQTALQREVAVKEIRELFGFFSDDQRGEIVRRFTEVVRAWGSLAHPNILPVHDVQLTGEFPYIVTELAPNGSARRLIVDAEELPVELVFKYLLQTLHALRAAHAQRVFHRGLKPEQMLLDAYGNVKVSDFGFQRIVERDHAVIRQVYVGMGNVAYMAPELYNDPAAAGPQGDIYALGIIFYELLTRKLPGRRSPMPSQINPSFPAGIDDIFDKMTRDAREERYQNVDEILEDIHKLEGLDALLDRRAQVQVGEHPLASVKFKPGTEEPQLGAAIADAEGERGGSHRPYSFQQRRKPPPR